MRARHRLVTAVDGWTSTKRSRYASDVFLAGQARWSDRVVSTAVFEVQARRWEGYADEASHLASYRAGLAQLARAPRAALDVGTGAGASARLLAQRWPGAVVTAVDTSRQMLRRARTLGGPSNLTYRRASALRLPFLDGCFDTVVSLNAFVELGELARVCTPDAQILMASTFYPLRDNDSDWMRRWTQMRYERVASGSTQPGSWEIFRCVTG